MILSNRGILWGNTGLHNLAKTMRVVYVTCNSATESSISVIGGREVRFGKIADHITSARPVFERVGSSMRSRIFDRITVARVRTFACKESRSIRIGGRMRCQFNWTVDCYC